MVILEINSHVSGSTGKIMLDTAEQARLRGHVVFTASAVHRSEKKIASNFHIYISNVFEKKIHNILRKYTGYNGIYSQLGTFFFLRKVDKISPDLIHIHNLHSCYLDMRQLFHYVKKNNIPIVWTMHDCWTFTGHCTYFDVLNCDGWKKDDCKQCKHYDEYPSTKVNRVAEMYNLKKKLFLNGSVKMLITPSQWLADLCAESFWKNTPVSVIRNGINTNIFKSVPNDIKQQLGIKDKFMVLGVASPWNYRKSPDIFIEISERLNKEEFQIVIIGSDGSEFNNNKNIIYIDRTNDQSELAAYYSAADVFVNPTREDNFPTVNIEALSCGTPVITFKTGGSAECISAECGIIVDKENIKKLVEAIISAKNKPFDRKKCAQKGAEYTRERQTDAYLKIYEKFLEKR